MFFGALFLPLQKLDCNFMRLLSYYQLYKTNQQRNLWILQTNIGTNSPAENFDQCNEHIISLSEFMEWMHIFLPLKIGLCAVRNFIVPSNPLILLSNKVSTWFVQYLNLFHNLVQIHRFPYFRTLASYGQLPVQSTNLS